MFFFIMFFFSLVILFLLRKIAKKIGLTDKPNVRKQHHGQIPLVGGLSIYFGLITGFYFFPTLVSFSGVYILCASVLVFIGVLDDKYDVNFKIRLMVEIGIACVMILNAGLYLFDLGNIFSFGNITLGPLGYVITVFAVLGAINAFNMVDGIDGLLGSLAIISFIMLAYIAYSRLDKDVANFCLMTIFAILPYLLLNLGIPYGRKFKVFMGDAGSMLIGFTVIWILLQMTQTEARTMHPVTALWIIALPLLDMFTVMSRRMLKGHSPFRADREHLHYLLLRAGLSSKQTLVVMIFFALLIAILGVSFELNGVPEYASFILFALLSVGYYIAVKKLSDLLAQGCGNILQRLFRVKNI